MAPPVVAAVAARQAGGARARALCRSLVRAAPRPLLPRVRQVCLTPCMCEANWPLSSVCAVLEGLAPFPLTTPRDSQSIGYLCVQSLLGRNYSLIDQLL